MSHGTGALPPIELAEYLGMANHIDYIDSTGVGGSCWEMFLEHAVAAIAQGQIDTVLLSYGSTSRADLKRKFRTANLFFGNRGPIQFDAPFGHTLIAKHAMSARRHMHEFGTTIEQLAEIAVSARYNAGFNPDAYYRDPITIEDVQSSKMIADPFTKLHCCIRSDGGRGHPPHPRGPRPRLRQHPHLGARHGRGHLAHHHERVDRLHRVALCPLGARRPSARPASPPPTSTWSRSTTASPSRCCSPSKASASARRARGAPSSKAAPCAWAERCPPTPTAGGLSSCQPGMRGIFLLVEAVKQLRGECGDRQVARRQAGRGQRHRVAGSPPPAPPSSDASSRRVVAAMVRP